MKRIVVVIGILVAIVTAVAACGQFLAAPDPETGADGGLDGAGPAPTEASAIGADGSSVSVSDGGCPVGAAFCADFETPPYDAGFEQISARPTNLAISVTQPPRRLRVTAAAGSFDDALLYWRHKLAAQVAKSFHVHFDMRVEKADTPAGSSTGPTVQIATVGWGNGPTAYPADRSSEIQILIDAANVYVELDEDPQPGVNEPGIAPYPHAPSAWLAVDVKLTFGQNRMDHVDVTVNGTPLMTDDFTSESDPIDPEIGLGFAGIDGNIASSMAIEYDNLVVEMQQ